MSFFQSNHLRDNIRVGDSSKQIVSQEALRPSSPAHTETIGELSSIRPTKHLPLSFDSDPPAPDQCGLFIRPNEFNPQHFHKALIGREGVYIGVGTFRALGAIGVGKFDHGVLLDYDHGTVLFNKANLSLICRSSTREEYLSRLFRTSLDKTILSRIDTSGESAREALGNPPIGLDEVSDARPRHIFSKKDMAGLRIDFASQEQWRATLFGSDSIFETVREMASSGRITAHCGDFVNGTRAIPSLTRALDQRGLRVSVIDLSNLAAHINPERAFAPNWSPDNAPPAQLPQADAWIRLSWNLSILPASRDAVVLCTDFYTMPTCRPRFASWSYSSLALSEYVMALREPDIAYARARLQDISNDSFINITREVENPHAARYRPDFIRAKSFT